MYLDIFIYLCKKTNNKNIDRMREEKRVRVKPIQDMFTRNVNKTHT